MKRLLLFILLSLTTLAFSKEVISLPSKYNHLILEIAPDKQSPEELLLTELDDMKNLFPFNEKLDPKDPSLCVETIAKKQQEEFIKSQDLTDLNPKDKNKDL